MADTLAKFQRQYPRVSLDVVLLERPTAVNPSEEGFDISIGGSASSFPGVVDEPICPLHKWVCAAPAYLEQRGTPQHPRELARHDCLLFAPTRQDLALRKRNRADQRRRAAQADRKRSIRADGRGTARKRHRGLAVLRRCDGTPRGDAGPRAPSVRGTDGLDEGHGAGEPRRRAARARRWSPS